MAPAKAHTLAVPPAVWKLGWTSFLTDVASEMVSSLLPVYLMLYLQVSPTQYGAVDGIYNGFAVAAVSLASGLMADRWQRHKELAVFGYSLSALSKLGLLALGSGWASLMAVIAVDRVGKGIRKAPRDALISLHSRREHFGAAFAVHRMMDSGGMLVGPALAFFLLWRMPDAYHIVWLASFLFALLGVTVLWTSVPRAAAIADPAAPQEFSLSAVVGLFGSPRFPALAGCGLLLALTTVSDGFLYLQLQRKGSLATEYFPLFYVLTSCFYMFFSVPLGRLADRIGRAHVLLAGYAILVPAYALLYRTPAVNAAGIVCFLAALGFHSAATEGVLMAMGSAVVPQWLRTSGLAILATVIGLGKFGSAMLFGWAWQAHGPGVAVAAFAASLLGSLAIAAVALTRPAGLRM